MKRFLPLLCLVLIVALGSCTKAQRIRGTWTADLDKSTIEEIVEADEDDIEKASGKAIITFAKDGTVEEKLDFSITEDGGRKVKFSVRLKGEYKVDGDKINYTGLTLSSLKEDGEDVLEGRSKKERKKAARKIKGEVDQIKKLTNKTLVLQDDDGVTITFKKQ